MPDAILSGLIQFSQQPFQDDHYGSNFLDEEIESEGNSASQ